MRAELPVVFQSEAKNTRPEIAFFQNACFLCGDCVPVCTETAILLEDGHITWDRLRCNQCGRCAEICLSHAFSMIGREMTAGTVIAEVLRDAAFYSGHGGMTLTGGEPTMQPEFAEALLRLAKNEGLHTAIETCGAVRWDNISRLLPHLDLVLFDVKHVDPIVHRKFTGASNAVILENLRRTTGTGANLAVRVPLIPEFNADRKVWRVSPNLCRHCMLFEKCMSRHTTLLGGEYRAWVCPTSWGSTRNEARRSRAAGDGIPGIWL
jgi:pyruvate formate lyase activating enzyme